MLYCLKNGLSVDSGPLGDNSTDNDRELLNQS